jgi:ubiquinone/menaquinone biosynthesis C-methylase UbiE
MAEEEYDFQGSGERTDGAAVLEHYLRRERAAADSGRHIRRLRNELHLVTRILSSLPFSETLLDLGCRGGRFSGPMQSAARLLIEADRHEAIARLAVERAMNPPRVAALTCSEERLPFMDESIDGVVCIRFSHRLDTDTQREKVLNEILRVSRRFVVFSYLEKASLPNLSRALRFRPATSGAMSTSRVAEIAAMHEAELRVEGIISPLGSRQKYVSLVKSP